MASEDDFDPRAWLEGFSAGDNSWIIGLTLKTAEGEEIEGVFQRVEADAAIMATTDGQVAVPLEAVEGVVMQMQSPGPE